MLGWEIIVCEKALDAADADQQPTVASWRAPLSGLRWLDGLVARGQARDLGGNGYPCRYELQAGVLSLAISAGIAPGAPGQAVISDDGPVPTGDIGSLNLTRLRALNPEVVVIVEAWDLS